MLEFFYNLFYAVGIQLLGILGIFFLFGFVLSKVEETTQSIYRQTVGWKGILWTAWIGTPIHELGHLFFAIIFRHKIQAISLFKPDARTGNLGHVDHSYKKYSLTQRIGNFFIGAAPMIFGSTFLFIMLYFLAPNGREVFLPLTAEQTSIMAVITTLKQTLVKLFAVENIMAWNFWIFLYISFCVVSHIAPSKIDRKGMWSGLLWIILILIIVNFAALLFKINVTDYILGINQYLGILIAIFTYALIVSFIHLLLATIILLPFRKK
ncbi:MAG: hypothetical protein WC862_01575 [Patescibacteria group bacterium]